MSANRGNSAVARALEGITEAMRAANLLTPVAAQIFGIFKKGNEEGKDPEEVKRESMEYVNTVIGKADTQLAVKPDGQ